MAALGSCRSKRPRVLRLCARAKILAGRFRSDERGVMSVLGAFFLVLGLSVSIVVVDVGHLYLAKRRLQSAVDAAALAAAGNPANADALARSALGRNGYQDDDLTVETGTYTADPALSVPARLDLASDTNPNAVRVTKAIATTDFFSGLFGGDGHSRVSATATAVRMPTVSFSTGSGLVSLSAGDINAVLGKLLGTNLTLTLANYTGLAQANIDALGMLNQLASQVDLAAGTYGDLASTNVTLGQLIAAARAELDIHPNGQDSAALDALNVLSLEVPQGVSATLGSLIDTTLWKTRNIGSIVQQDSGQTVINLFDMVSAMARLYGAGHLADLGTGLTIPVTNTSVSAYLSAGEPMASISSGEVGTALNTSEVRLALTVTAADVNLGIARATVRVPVYVQMATGRAQVSAIPCNPGGTMVEMQATPMAVSAQIGSVDLGSLSDYGTIPVSGQPAIVSLSVLGIPVNIAADAAVTVAAGPAATLQYSRGDIDAGTVKSTGADTQHLMSGLVNNLNLTVQGSGITGAVNALVAGTVMPLLKPLLASILSSLDPVVAGVLQSAGLQLGTVSVAVHGVSCGRPTIVG